MELLEGNGKEQKIVVEETPQPTVPAQQSIPVKKTHEQCLQEFAGELNGVLQKGYPLPAVLEVLESAIFELRLSLYMQQMEQMEKEKRNKLQVPKMTIPTGKIK